MNGWPVFLRSCDRQAVAAGRFGVALPQHSEPPAPISVPPKTTRQIWSRVMPSKFAVFEAAGRLIRRVAERLEPPEPDSDSCASYELPSWAYRKAPDDGVYRWHDLRPTREGESDE